MFVVRLLRVRMNRQEIENLIELESQTSAVTIEQG
jgi:hypothetical protein